MYEGRGKYLISSGTLYEGFFINGTLYGKGRAIFSQG
jgi:hypothetical protein